MIRRVRARVRAGLARLGARLGGRWLAARRPGATVTAWNDGDHRSDGTGYALRLDPAERDRLFDRTWTDVVLELPNGAIRRLALSPAFWGHRPELRAASIGRWLVAAGHGRWPAGRPPAFRLVRVGANRFRVVAS